MPSVLSSESLVCLREFLCDSLRVLSDLGGFNTTPLPSSQVDISSLTFSRYQFAVRNEFDILLLQDGFCLWRGQYFQFFLARFA